jgi:hypothetical protein
VVILHETLHELRRKKMKGIIMKLDFEKAYDRVSWPFFMEVLERKGFPMKWRGWMEQVVTGGRVGINLNGKPGEFFRTFKGLRQGDLLSPLLFNLVADTLSTMLNKAREGGFIKGLVPNLVEGGLTHLQYAYDTIICLEVDENSIAHTKFLLYCFESLSSLKINYHKSEVMVMGVSDEESARIGNVLNCKEGVLPMKYLGILVSKTHVYDRLDLCGVKVEKRLPAWQQRYLSSWGKSILIE